MRIAIINVPERGIPQSLTHCFTPMNYDLRVFTDTQHVGAAWNHLRALDWAATSDEPTIILEDDAIPTSHVAEKLFDWTRRREFRHTDATSFYLGKGAPVYAQRDIQTLITAAENIRDDHVISRTLYHAVAYCINPLNVAHVVERLHELELTPKTAVDATIGSILGRDAEIMYTLPSLFDHDDSLKSTVKHSGRRPTEPRVAWRFKQ